MRSINIAEAKAKLSELLDRATAAEEIVIARSGRPIARNRTSSPAPAIPQGAEKHCRACQELRETKWRDLS